MKIKDADNEIDLTPTEGRILFQLIQHGGNVVPHAEMIEQIWGDNYPDAGETLRVYIHQLREKLKKDPAKPERLLNKPGVGYYLVK